MSGQLGDPPAGAAPVPGGGMTLDGSAASSGGLGLAGTEVIASELTGTGHLRIWLRSVPPQGQHTFFIVTLDAVYQWVPAEPVPEPVD